MCVKALGHYSPHPISITCGVTITPRMCDGHNPYPIISGWINLLILLFTIYYRVMLTDVLRVIVNNPF